jgi:hypothetical protein
MASEFGLPEQSSVISFTCPTCSKTYSVPSDRAGKTTKCSACGEQLRVPEPMVPPPQPAGRQGRGRSAPADDVAENKSDRLATRDGPGRSGKPGLVPCKVCGSQVAKAAPTCPKCGVSRPGAATGKLVLMRSSAVTGGIHPVEVRVDGELRGELRNGGQMTLELEAGPREVEVRGGGLSRSVAITITDGETQRYQLYFSAWGILGGGLNLKPA